MNLQHVNLLPKEIEYRRPHLNGITVWIYSTLLCTFMIAGIVWSHLDHQKLKVSGDKVAADYQRILSQYEDINKKILDEIGSEATVVAIDELKIQIAQNQALLNLLKPGDSKKLDIPRYVSILNDHKIVGLMIDKLAFLENGRIIFLKAKGNNSAALTDFLHYLKSTHSFKDFHFNVVSSVKKTGGSESLFELVCYHKGAVSLYKENVSLEDLENSMEQIF